MNYVYLLLEEGTSPEHIQASLNEVAEVENAKTDRFKITHETQNLGDIAPGKDLSNGSKKTRVMAMPFLYIPEAHSRPSLLLTPGNSHF